nr:biotin/lipoyl-binding protein [Candidatus Accumulibacter phosphatis]
MPSSSPSRTRLTTVLSVAVLVLGAAFAAFYFASERSHSGSGNAKAASATPTSPAKRTALAVSTVQAQQTTWSQQLSVSGGVFPWQEAVIAAETSGLRVVEVAVDVGSVVRRGQLLAELARDSVDASLAQQEANLARARLPSAKPRPTPTARAGSRAVAPCPSS